MASLETLLERLRVLGDDSRSGVELAKPINEGALEWLRERFRTRLERELPEDLASLLKIGDGCQIGDVTMLGSAGIHGLVDHNLEWRAPPSNWLAGQIIVGKETDLASYVIDVDAGKCHVSDYITPQFTKTFASFTDLLFHIMKKQIEPKVRDLS
jgi:hypothetical protein